nr:8199_t:CDS:1 [Entrophospora candida]CAG8581701.1 1988_t:CDS:1 [Entrophospora candida]
MTITHIEEKESEPSTIAQEQRTKNDETYALRTILLIGRTGSGKSTLANVITGTDDFKESSGSISETKEYEIKDYLINGKSYRIVDTVGIGDTRLTDQQVLNKLAEAADRIQLGLYQILFVANGRFTEEEIKAYDLLREVVFDKDVVKYTSIVRTNFPDFNDYDKCMEDIKNMIGENDSLSHIVQTCKKVIYVDNPPLTGYYKEVGKASRADSRERILDHLKDCNDIYLPKNIEKVNKRIADYMSEKDKLKKQVEELKKKLEKETEEKKLLEDEIKKLNSFIKRCIIS